MNRPAMALAEGRWSAKKVSIRLLLPGYLKKVVSWVNLMSSSTLRVTGEGEAYTCDRFDATPQISRPGLTAPAGGLTSHRRGYPISRVFCEKWGGCLNLIDRVPQI